MDICDRCNVCDRPGTLVESPEVARVPANVRQFKAEQFTVWRCHHCRSLHSKEAIALARYYSDYPVNSLKLNYATRCIFGKRLRRLKACGVTQRTALLEIGCGSGVFLAYLRAQGYSNVCGYDPYVAPFDRPEVLSRQYAAVVSYEVLEHADDPVAYLNTCARCLEVGGQLIVQTPCADRLPLDDPYYHSLLHQPYHRHILSKEALVYLADRAGLETVGIDEGRRGNSMDTLFPFVNSRLFVSYMYRFGNELDLLFEPPRWPAFRSPTILALAAIGYFFPLPTHMTAVLRKRSS